MSASYYHFPSECDPEAAEAQFRVTKLSDVFNTLDILADSIRRATKTIYLLCQQLIIWLTVLLNTFFVLTQPLFLRRLNIDKDLSFIVATIASVALLVSLNLFWRIGIIFLVMKRARRFRRELVHIIARSSSEGEGNEYF